MSTCPETIDGRHHWTEYTIPARVHYGPAGPQHCPAYTERECLACGTKENAR